MRGREMPRRDLGWLRRGLALGLGAAAVWMMSTAVCLPGPGAALEAFAQSPRLVVGAVSAQLDWTQRTDAQTAIGPLGRLLLDQSPLLADSAQLVERQTDRVSGAQEPDDAQQGDPDDRQEQPLEPLPAGKVQEHTSLGSDSGGYLSSQEVYLKNVSGQSVDLNAVLEQPVALELGEGPQILIYHTHGSEAYTQAEQERYVESDSYRTTDCAHNVVRVGEEMAAMFRAQGFGVVHDTTLYDYPAYNGAYERSRAGVERWLAQYPTIRFVLDVHRDALVSSDGAAYKLIAQEGEEKVAQVMLVVGSGDSGLPHPNWRANLALAVKLQLALTARYDQLARPITLRASRFNQHLSSGALLVEVGGHGNTLEEAVAGGRMFARTVGAALKQMQG